MVQAKRDVLPKDFEALLEAGDLTALKAVFETCDVDARGGYAKQTAVAFDRCPDELVRWLVEKGADLGAQDRSGNTPLHTRACSWRGSIAALLELGADVHAATISLGTPLHVAADAKHIEHVELLLAHGAQVDAHNRSGMTPLEVAVSGATNAQLDRMPAVVRALLDAGATRTPALKGFVERLGQTFEFHRDAYAPDSVDAASAALYELYAIFDVTPVPRRVQHGGKAAIETKARTWQQKHADLWTRLVPSQGSAATMQGEVIRITGRISDEWYRNGGCNWDHAYQQMAEALVEYMGHGTPLAPAALGEVASIVRSLEQRGGEGDGRLAELAVAWVEHNPTPIALEDPSYPR